MGWDVKRIRVFIRNVSQVSTVERKEDTIMRCPCSASDHYFSEVIDCLYGKMGMRIQVNIFIWLDSTAET